MAIDPQKPFNPIIGDDKAYNSLVFRDVPDGFKFKDLQVDKNEYPLTFDIKDKIFTFADNYYADYEVVGNTLVNFFERLNVKFLENIGTFEKMMAVYYDDIANPILGRTEKTTYNLINTADNTSNDNNKHIDVPVDDLNPAVDDKPASIDVGNSTNNGTSTQKGTVETELSDLGVRNNFESLNGFLDNNRTYYSEFVRYFKECFTLAEVLTW